MADSSCSTEGCDRAIEIRSRRICKRCYSRLRARGKLPAPIPRPCVRCGMAVEGRSAGARYCSDQCAKMVERPAATRAERRAVTARRLANACRVCGVNISHLRANSAYCGDECRGIATGITRVGPRTERACALQECGATFGSFSGRTRCCSELHGKRLWNRESRADGRQTNPAWDDRRRNNYHKRRALKAGSAAGPAFTNAEVFERDGWVCGLCDEPVSPGAVYPDPLSASLDHVVPLSRGGAHSLENSQLAHLACNVRKGAREDSVLMA